MNQYQIDEIKATPLEYKKVKEFVHCKSCIEQFLNSELHKVMTPKEYGLYEIGLCDFTYPDGTTAKIMTAWCKRCGKSVWDGRDLTKMY